MLPADAGIDSLRCHDHRRLFACWGVVGGRAYDPGMGDVVRFQRPTAGCGVFGSSWRQTSDDEMPPKKCECGRPVHGPDPDWTPEPGMSLVVTH